MKLATFAATLALGALAWAGGPGSTSTPPKKAPAATAVRKATPVSYAAKRPVSHAASTSHTAATAVKRTARRAPVVRATWRTRQTAPTADRYREIQEALVARGYLSAEDADGTWGPSSTEALKRFQAEQTLDSTGKIDSLSLIALGLGPRHDNAVAAPRVADGNVQTESGRN